MSMSCSDKILKWNFCGLQGCLVGNIVGEIKLKSIIVGGGNFDCIERGLITRIDQCTTKLLVV